MAVPLGILSSAGARRSRRRPPGLGFSLVEILVTMSIMLVLAATTQIYYGAVLPEQRIGRAKTDIQQYKKAVGYLRNSYKAGPLSSDVFRYEEDGPPWSAALTAYRTVDAPGADPGLEKLLKFNIVPNLVLDPWGGDYHIDVQRGWIYSYGPDGVPHVGDNLGDDIVDAYQPEFKPVRARLTQKDLYLEVEFSRELSRTVVDSRNQPVFQMSKGNFVVATQTISGDLAALQSRRGENVATAVVDLASPFTVRLRLVKPVALQLGVMRDSGDGNFRHPLRSADGALLSTDKVLLTTGPASAGFYLPPPS
ncbi:MAG: prepilin-type N-terminal cleavage/methylation domain-containing protein [Candidatus Wallbacteria bacterium]|nr:prepilin-type N-terminal cleavage/methylation domain-containing protein [Candidatus Wallbacteria bacterium]